MSYIPKQNIATISFSDMSGGINNSVAPALIAENECVDILNMEYNQSRLVTRGGLGNALRTYSGGDTYKLQQIFYDEIAGYYVIDSNSHIWYDNLSADYAIDLGALTGTIGIDNKASFCKFDNKIFVASGGHLQYVTTSSGNVTVVVDTGEANYRWNTTTGALEVKIGYTLTQADCQTLGIFLYNNNTTYTRRTLTTISASPQCSGVFQRFGRLAVYHTGDDNIYFSAVGDPYETGWTEDTDDDSSSKWIEIGYKDDGDLLKVVPVVNDLLIFKSNGSVYNLSGAILQETVQLMAENTDVKNPYSICYISGAAYYVTDRGLMVITPDVTYANFKFVEASVKFSKGFKGNVLRPRMYNLFRKMQLMICPNSDTYPNTFWCYQYDKGAATRITFPSGVADMAQTKDGVIVVSGKSLYRWKDSNTTDSGTAISSKIETRVILGNDKTIVRSVDSQMTSTTATSNNMTITISDTERAGHAIVINTTPTKGRKKTLCNHSTRAAQLKLESTNPYELEHLAIEMTGFSR